MEKSKIIKRLEDELVDGNEYFITISYGKSSKVISVEIQASNVD